MSALAQVPALARFCFPDDRADPLDDDAADALRAAGLPAAFASTRYRLGPVSVLFRIRVWDSLLVMSVSKSSLSETRSQSVSPSLAQIVKSFQVPDSQV